VFEYNIILDMIYVPLAIILSYVSVASFSYLEEKKKKKEIEKAFGKFVSPKVINELLSDPKRLVLGGEKRDITIFFSDIASFTSISEELKPEDLVSFLNKYLNNCTKIILENDGLVDKYIGDAIVAFWGAPLKQENQYYLACDSALKMVEKLGEFRKEFNRSDFNFRIGLNFGPAIVGNMGSDERFDYTAIGDTINLAARLEGINKYYYTNICVSEYLYEKVKNKFVFRELDIVKVKGKKKPLKIYELIAHNKKSLAKDKLKILKIYQDALNLYIKGNFSKASALFEQGEKLKDGPSKVMGLRCREFEINPPKNWDGVYEMKKK
jgi:adenylate cyclase